MNIKEVIEGLYKDLSLMYGSARNKWNICKAEKALCYELQMANPKGSKEYIKWEKIKDRWADLSTRVSWEWHFYGFGYGGYGMGGRVLAEKIYEAIGCSVEDLPEFEQYDGLRILSPLTFSEIPPEEIISLEKEFEPEDQIFREGSWEERYRAIFDYTSLDIYRMISVALWYDDVLDREDIPGDKEEVLAMWDLSMEGSRNFLYYGRNCLAETEISSRSFFMNQQMDMKRKFLIRAKYIKNNERQLKTKGRLFRINEAKLPVEWKKKVTKTVPVME